MIYFHNDQQGEMFHINEQKLKRNSLALPDTPSGGVIATQTIASFSWFSLHPETESREIACVRMRFLNDS